jgi:hypothetical protein
MKAQPNKIRTVTKPDECVSVNQLESPVPGFKGLSKAFFFRERYKVATIFVNQFSRLSYVHLQESTKGEETLLAKRAFEAYVALFRVVIPSTMQTMGGLLSASISTTWHCTVKESPFVASMRTFRTESQRNEFGI